MSTKSVLIVDDEIEILEIMEHRLKQYDITLTKAKNGYDVLFLMENNTFDLIITDLRMPKTDGVTLIEEVRGHRNNNDAKIIVLSGYLSKETIKTLEEYKVSEILSKPVDIEEFEAILQKYLTKNA
jgi:CheY-like chemotaxis protein